MGRIEERKPFWLRFAIPGGESYGNIKKVIKQYGLHTVCAEARCPNIGECYGTGTAAFLILGPVCTRNCRYCSVSKGIPQPPAFNEPEMIAKAVSQLGISYIVVTSVTRDDLEDGGSSLFVETVNCIRKYADDCTIELLVPDFKNSMESSIDSILESSPDVINHNIEVASSLFHELRPQGDYHLSLQLLNRISKAGIISKSGLMIGFGETIRDIHHTLCDLHDSGCRNITVGQYLQSSKENYPVKKYYHPDEFLEIESMAKEIGINKIMAGPLVRSSYHAASFQE